MCIGVIAGPLCGWFGSNTMLPLPRAAAGSVAAATVPTLTGHRGAEAQRPPLTLRERCSTPGVP